ncbi:uncharacterized protein LY89DRAFT_731304 [Mollisia scopiformis]|uniref:Uncharacterized protein n=1 Tax=Mollisia scopiformis TaxID=149040 RepID=A0A194XIX7_MOLSC|nr:uncharacterized protein LY89DRAFT_731304 [Mollisia scopiformis]KUJ20069.1 hypothetical protein LY89DRAFT_731304 [Mollisia scopiformis]
MVLSTLTLWLNSWITEIPDTTRTWSFIVGTISFCVGFIWALARLLGKFHYWDIDTPEDNPYYYNFQMSHYDKAQQAKVPDFEAKFKGQWAIIFIDGGLLVLGITLLMRDTSRVLPYLYNEWKEWSQKKKKKNTTGSRV